MHLIHLASSPQTPLVIALGSAVVALGSAILSGITLWKTHYAGFSAVTAVGSLTQRIYPIRSERESWFLFSLHLPISITNAGARPGLVSGIRIRTTFPNLPIPGHYESLPAKFEVDFSSYQKLAKERFRMLAEAVISHWMPFIVLPKATVTKDLLFETRWDEPVVQESVRFVLELSLDGSKTWQEVATWESSLSPASWGEMANRGTAISASPRDSVSAPREVHPPDLHKYTGTKDEIPKDGFGVGPSYLAYPEDS
jgi:hypothetical protein